MKSKSAGDSSYTVANAKGIYMDLLTYFATKQDTLFNRRCRTPPHRRDQCRQCKSLQPVAGERLAEELSLSDVFVFDFYNVLTDKRRDAKTNDSRSRNRQPSPLVGRAVQHQVYGIYNTTAYHRYESPKPGRKPEGDLNMFPLLCPIASGWDHWPLRRCDSQQTKPRVNAPLAVRFTDTTTGSPTMWNWSFDDGCMVQHNYLQPEEPDPCLALLGSF